MGRVLLDPFSTQPTPRAATLNPMESSCSPRNFLPPAKPSCYPSPRSPHYLTPLSRSPRYLSPLSPKHPKYLSPPFDGKCHMTDVHKSHSIFGPCLGLKGEGELLMQFLTGVPGSPLENYASRMDTFDTTAILGDDGETLSPRGAQIVRNFLELVKKSAGRIGLRAQLLHELSLGDDVNMGIPDSELPSLLPVEKMGTEILTKHGDSQSKDQEINKAIPIYKGAMRATSLVIKRLRRMVIDFGSITCVD